MLMNLMFKRQFVFHAKVSICDLLQLGECPEPRISFGTNGTNVCYLRQVCVKKKNQPLQLNL